MEENLFKNETYKIIGVLFEVHKNLGKGFAEIDIKMQLNMNFNNWEFRMKEKKNTK